MHYQCSLEGNIGGQHIQLDVYDAYSFQEAMDEVKNRRHLPWNKHEEWLALLFSNKAEAIKDGVPETEISDVWGDGRLFRWKAKIF